jgi:hypothetical protein
MVDLHKLGLYNCLDLTNKQLHTQLLAILLDKWSKTILYDFTIDKEQLKPLHFTKSLEFQNQKYWLNLSSQQRTRQKKLLQTLSLDFGANTHQQISTFIEHQYKSLMI